MSKVEYDKYNLGISSDSDLLSWYKKEGIDGDLMFESHLRQKEGLRRLLALYPQFDVKLRQDMIGCSRQNLIEFFQDYDVIVSFGGDNHFQYLSHYVDEQMMIGITADPKLSDGGLLHKMDRKTWEDLESLLNEKSNMSFYGRALATLSQWTRLEVSINGVPQSPLALCEVFLGEERRLDMSRHIVEIKNKKFEQKSSGILLVTGAGETGWLRSVDTRIFHDEPTRCLARDSQRFIFAATEVFRSKHHGESVTFEILGDNDAFEITSLNDANGIVSTDCLETFPFGRGAKAKIRLGSPLNVINLEAL